MKNGLPRAPYLRHDACRRNGIGLLRYLLALFIVGHHVGVLRGDGLTWLSEVPAVGLFFALSGFFAWNGHLDHGPVPYMLHRLRRLLPAYWLTVVVSALCLMPLSACGPLEYLSAPGLWKYLAANLTFLNFLAPDLPGVFAHQAVSAVNGSLWFVKIDLLFALTVPLMAALGRWAASLSRYGAVGQGLLRVVLVLYLGVSIALLLLAGDSDLSGHTAAGKATVYLHYYLYFLAGCAVQWSYDVMVRYRLAAIVAGVAFWVFVVRSFSGEALSLVLLPLGVTIAAVALFTSPTAARLAPLNRQNCSYEIYLLHFPVIQAIISLSQHASGGSLSFAALFLLSVLVTAPLAWGLNRITARMVRG